MSDQKVEEQPVTLPDGNHNTGAPPAGDDGGDMNPDGNHNTGGATLVTEVADGNHNTGEPAQ
jgi:hypothetical protein